MKRGLVTGVLALMALAWPPGLRAQQVQVDEVKLDNGMTLLLVPRRGNPNVAAGWLAKVGSANERPGITGLSHLFEHMMFKGTRVIGTSNIDEDLKIIGELDAVKAELRVEEEGLIRKLRLGQISDLRDPANRTPRHQQLLKRFEELLAAQKKLLIKNEFDKIYTQAGATGLNAATTEDQTFYFINVPSNKLELWFWLESDRLANPVFREFYSERDVVYEERRLRTDSTPTGKFREEFNSMFWTSHPYGWPVVGWPSDLDGITREEALDYFAINYAPNNLVACLVGDFDADEVKRLAKKYFGRLKRNPHEQEPVRTREVPQEAEKRMVAFAETNPEVEIRYHSVADGHVDEPALLVLGALLNGRTGRLYKSLVLDQQIANSAFAGQNGMKWAGYFTLRGVAKPGHTPEDVEKALYQELDKLKTEKVGERELQKVKNQFAADNFRRIESSFFLMIQLLFAEANRGWQSFNEDPKRLEAVTTEDIQRVANLYFKPENRAVALYYTKQAAEGEEADPILAGLTPDEQAQVKQMRAMLARLPNEKASEMLERMESQGDNVPPDQRKVVEAVKKLLRQKLEAAQGDQR